MTTNKNPPAEQDRGAEVSEGTDRHRVTHAADVPEYRSDAWRQLPADDPRRIAATFAAADCWYAIAQSPHAAEFVREVIDWRRRKVYSDWSSAVAEICAGRMPGPSYAELERRRAVVGPLPAEFAQRHGHPYRGGPVDWETGRPVKVSADTLTREAA